MEHKPISARANNTACANSSNKALSWQCHLPHTSPPSLMNNHPETTQGDLYDLRGQPKEGLHYRDTVGNDHDQIHPLCMGQSISVLYFDGGV